MNKILAYLGKLKTTPAAAYQAVHLLLGYSIVVTSAILWHAEWWAAGGLLGFVLLIELWYDPRYEGQPFWFDGFVDTMFYLVGISAGLLLVGG